jgi:hypothetical protein
LIESWLAILLPIDQALDHALIVAVDQPAKTLGIRPQNEPGFRLGGIFARDGGIARSFLICATSRK